MLIEDVRKRDPVGRFVYWVGERMRIYERRCAGEPKPWTDDTILQANYFTNVHRELDKTTQWFREFIREPRRGSPDVLFATACFRWFNLIQTGELLIENGLLDEWDAKKALRVLGRVRSEGRPVFTGAYMINSPAGVPKLEAIVDRISNVWRAAKTGDLFNSAARWLTLEGAHLDLMEFDGLGGFMAYEIVCDLRHTRFLENARDIDTWANPGPGAVRGMYRVLGMEIPNKSNATAPPAPAGFQNHIQTLLALLKEQYPDALTFEAREVEQSLCEFDKYERLLFGQGRSKRTYDGRGTTDRKLEGETNQCLW